MRHLSTASEGAEAMSQELFPARLDALIDLPQSSAKVSGAIPCHPLVRRRLQAALAPTLDGTVLPLKFPALYWNLWFAEPRS